jgi:hypothetical protein
MASGEHVTVPSSRDGFKNLFLWTSRGATLRPCRVICYKIAFIIMARYRRRFRQREPELCI